MLLVTNINTPLDLKFYLNEATKSTILNGFNKFYADIGAGNAGYTALVNI